MRHNIDPPISRNKNFRSFCGKNNLHALAACFKVPAMRANDDLPPAPCECGRDLTDHDREQQDGLCARCRKLQHELDLEAAWFVWLNSLKNPFDRTRMEAVSDALAGWKQIDGDIQHERTSKGVAVATANNLRFLAPGHRGHLIFSEQNGLPVVIVHGGKDHKFPDWTATFTACTPIEAILTATNAVIHHN
jgi:hypothetical protein